MQNYDSNEIDGKWIEVGLATWIEPSHHVESVEWSGQLHVPRPIQSDSIRFNPIQLQMNDMNAQTRSNTLKHAQTCSNAQIGLQM